MERQLEHGFKWWLRYVIVPLVGGGGIIAVVVAKIDRPKDAAPYSNPSVEKSVARRSEDEKVDFFLSTKARQREDREAVIGIGDTVLIHWNIANSHGESFYLKEVDLQGNTLLSRQVETVGILPYNTTETVDCISVIPHMSSYDSRVLFAVNLLILCGWIFLRCPDSHPSGSRKARV